jgi:hypothetical protein
MYIGIREIAFDHLISFMRFSLHDFIGVSFMYIGIKEMYIEVAINGITSFFYAEKRTKRI